MQAATIRFFSYMPRDQNDAPTCPLTYKRMRRWMHVPIDAMKAERNAFAHLYWSDAAEYGCVYPQPTPVQCRESYRVPGYYTHADAVDRSACARRSWLDKLRAHLAWRLDAGQPISAERVHALTLGPARICDIGCGSGALASRLAELGHNVTGVDPDPNAAARNCRSIEFHAGSAEQLPAALRGRVFDAVVLSHVLEHSLDPRRVLQNAYALLAPGGVLICEVPNNAALALAVSGCSWPMLDVPRHLHFFTARSLTWFANLAGFHVEHVYYAHYQRQFSNAWIAREQELHAALAVSADCRPRLRRNSRFRSWCLLARTLIATRARKYDSTGLIARRLGTCPPARVR